MIGNTYQDPGAGASDTDGQAGLEQDPSKHANGPPKEGSNRGFETDERARAKIEDSISGRSPKSHSDHTDDGRPDETQVGDEGVRDPAQPT